MDARRSIDHDGAKDPSADQTKASPIKSVVNDTDHQAKKVKLSNAENVYLRDLPSSVVYEKSYMHRQTITHVLVTPHTQFLVTASVDGIVKFWKKTSVGIEFVKSFKAHAGPIDDMAVTSTGAELATISEEDKTVKIFDVVNFDMINMFSLDFKPKCVEWIEQSMMNNENLLISDSQSNTIYTFDARQSTDEPKSRITKIHNHPVSRMRRNTVHNIIVSVDSQGVVKYWRAKDCNYNVVQLGKSKSKHDSIIEDFLRPPEDDCAKLSEVPRVHNISFAPHEEYMAITSSDRKVRIYLFIGARLSRVYDNSLKKFELDKKSVLSHLDYARRVSIELEIERLQLTRYENVVFDVSGNFVLFPTIMGVEMWNWKRNKQIRIYGAEETNYRPLCVALFQGLIYDKVVRRFNIDAIESSASDPTLFSTNYKKNRFYCFSNRHFEEDSTGGEDGELLKDRDIYNERPTAEEVMAAVELEQQQKTIFENATIYTTKGDIHLKLFPQYAPKACENFCVHSSNGYYNNHIFHRVIDKFMIQTGDPTGTGTGGQSIWDDDFEDEFCDELTHAKPFMLSMANCGPNTNGSQFFITVAPCAELDRKHTIFGKVTKGMDVCVNISKVDRNRDNDKPTEDIKIINISVS